MSFQLLVKSNQRLAAAAATSAHHGLLTSLACWNTPPAAAMEALCRTSLRSCDRLIPPTSASSLVGIPLAGNSHLSGTPLLTNHVSSSSFAWPRTGAIRAVATSPRITSPQTKPAEHAGTAKVATLGIPSKTTWEPIELPRNLRELATAVTSPGFRKAVSSPQAMMQAAYTAARTAFFTGQALAAARSTRYKAESTFDFSQPLATLEAFWQRSRGVYGSIAEMHRQDMENVKAGLYRAPYDMHPLHRQWRPSYILENNNRLLKFGEEFIGRQERQGRKEVLDTLKDGKARDIYPDYYLQNFHYQTDGWLSDSSARVYEYSTETLFFGSQDAMQRQSLVPLHYFMQGRDPATTRFVDLACGTGRFLTFVKDNYPTMHCTGVDLSPYYLAVAQENMDYLYEFDRSVNKDRGLTKAEYVQANAESLPFADASLDVVSVIYLFHELPVKARQAVAKEMHRVLKPGGIVIFNDSLQRGDRPEADKALAFFPQNYHEPYYMSYIKTDLAKLFASQGLLHESTQIAHMSKIMCFRK